MGGWLMIVLAFFAYPLSAFTPALTRLKENGLIVLGAQATGYFRAAERKAIGRNIFADPSPELEVEVGDPAKLYEASSKLQGGRRSRRRRRTHPIRHRRCDEASLQGSPFRAQKAAAVVTGGFCGSGAPPLREAFCLLR
jgi:hypothetical protein